MLQGTGVGSKNMSREARLPTRDRSSYLRNVCRLGLLYQISTEKTILDAHVHSQIMLLIICFLSSFLFSWNLSHNSMQATYMVLRSSETFCSHIWLSNMTPSGTCGTSILPVSLITQDNPHLDFCFLAFLYCFASRVSISIADYLGRFLFF